MEYPRCESKCGKYDEINAKLKPCSLCGGRAKINERSECRDRFSIKCGRCHTRTMYQNSVDKLVEKWNGQEEGEEGN